MQASNWYASNPFQLDTASRLFRHRRTGAEVLSLANSDENKSFAVTFRTLPSDDTGVAHILEHSVLSGSGKYPVKELFMELLKGSCATFINAMTYPDKTCYPVASTNLKDFYNLVDVYFDVVFNPLLESHTLDQEGWHFELEGSNAPLSYKGVVFNEMKGAYSLQDAHIGEQVTRALLPNTIYANSSGGDPRHIPELSHARWREFHRCFYHPSNARICFWGDDPEETRLRIVDEALKPFDRQPVSEKIALQSRFNPGGVPQNGVQLDGDRSQARGVGEVLVALAGEFVEGGIVGGRIRRVLVELVAKVPGCLNSDPTCLTIVCTFSSVAASKWSPASSITSTNWQTVASFPGSLATDRNTWTAPST